METEFAATAINIAEMLVPQQERTVMGSDWVGDAKTEDEINRAMGVRRVVGSD